jgi:hypothetical protein
VIRAVAARVVASCDARSWNAKVRAAFSAPHVVQERVELGGGEFPYAEKGALRYRRYNAGFDPYVWNNRTVHGCLVRLSTTSLLNVASAGSVVPVFLVDEL